MDVGSLSDALRLDPDTGIWRANVAAGDFSYPADHNAACFRIEDDSFWFSHRNRCITAAVRRLPPDGFILDVGGGNGYVARGLMDAGYETVLLEPGADGAQHAKRDRRLPTVINATIAEAHIRPAVFPTSVCSTCSNTSRTIETFVGQMFDLVRPGGFLYLTVPSFNWLWSMSDVDAMHYRRYTRRSLGKVLAGRFDVLYSTYLFQRLVPVSFLMRALPYASGWRARSQRPHMKPIMPADADGWPMHSTVCWSTRCRRSPRGILENGIEPSCGCPASWR